MAPLSSINFDMKMKKVGRRVLDKLVDPGHYSGILTATGAVASEYNSRRGDTLYMLFSMYGGGILLISLIQPHIKRNHV